MSIGTQFQQAREAKKVSLSEAAAAIRTKVQQVEALETDHFERFASPVYARGFIKLYAEYLGLDPAPLLREYSERHAPTSRSPLIPPTVAAPRKRRTTVTEEGVVETTEVALPPTPAPPTVQPSVVASEPAKPPPVAAELSVSSLPTPEIKDSATTPDAVPPPARSRWAVAAAAVVVAAAIAAALLRSNRRQASPAPPPAPTPGREAVSPILELPPEPLLDPFADEGTRTRQ